MEAKRTAEIRQLRGLKNLAWLSWGQISRLAAALAVEPVAKREVFIDEKQRLPERAFVLLTGVNCAETATPVRLSLLYWPTA
jgi:hypothetical protein